MKATIKAILKTRSPLHIAHPDSIRMNSKGGLEYGENGFPCTAVQKLRIPVHVSASSESEQKDKNFNKAYPVIASNNIAGRMRRYAAKHVLNALAAKGQKLSLHAYSVLMCGASTGKPDSDDMTYAEYQTSRQHPYFGLFGGGPKMFERKVRVHNAMPITHTLTSLKGNLAHPNAQEFAVNDQTRFTAMWGFRRLDDLRDLSNIELAEATIENFEVEFEKRQALILADKPANKDDAATSNEPVQKPSRNSTKTYSAIEFVIPGVLFDLTMELDVANDAQTGLFLETLDAFAAEERLGGYVRNGFGVITFENIQMTTEDGTSINLFNNGRLDRSNIAVATWIAAWVKAIAGINAADIDALIAVVAKETKEEKAAKKSKITKEKADAGDAAQAA